MTRLGMLALLLGLVFLLAACNPNQPPSADLNANPLLLNVQVSWSAADPEGDAFSCTLKFGDGHERTFTSCPTSYAIPHTYAQGGTYTLQLVLTDAQGHSNTVQKTLTLPARPAQACPAPPSTASTLSRVEPQGAAFAPGAATVPGKILVKLSGQKVDLAALSTAGAKLLAKPRPGWALLKVSVGQERLAAEALVAKGLARYAQPVYRYRLLSTPNDTYFGSHQASQFEQMRLTEGWDLLSAGACRPIAAVVDSGADLDHPDLATHLLPGYDFSDGDNDPSNANDHGTMVSGIIGAITNNGQGVAGSTDNLAYVVPAKVFPNATSTTIADAIRWATDAGAHLINLSLCITDNSGTHCADLHGNPDAYIEDALQYAYNHGVIAVAASGNDGYNYIGYPASSSYTLAVGSVNASGNRSSFSNYGPDLDFVAPGESVTNTIPNDTYGTGDGTSFATPYVVGELALYLGQYYALKGSMPSFSQAATCFQNNTNQASRNDETGFGIPQADQFLDTTDGSCFP